MSENTKTRQAKEAIVERLKANEYMSFGGLFLLDKMFMGEHWKDLEYRDETDGSWVECLHEDLDPWIIYRLRADFELPADKECPNGFRIVSMFDRKRCAYPTDCKVMYKQKGAFIVSKSYAGWINPIFKFAVPHDYILAEDRPVAKKARFFFDLRFPTIDNIYELTDAQFAGLPDTSFMLEVKEIELPYLKKPDGDWEFRKCDAGDIIIEFTSEGHGPEHKAISTYSLRISGYRWCRPREKAFLYCEIKEVGMKWCVEMKNHPWSKRSTNWWLPLSEVADLVGFAGVKFENQNDNDWAMIPRAFIDDSGFVTHYDNVSKSIVPATPIKARFLVEAK